MHNETELTVGRARRVLAERIIPAVHSAREPVEVAWRPLAGEPIAPAEGLALDYEPYQVGTPWGPAWGTTWFRLRGTIPQAWQGRRVELLVDLGFDPNMPGFQCEALAYLADGTPLKSLNPRNQYVCVANQAAGGEAVEIFLEAASNPVLLDYHPFLPTEEGDILTSSPRLLYTTRRMELAVFEPEVFELACDIDVLFELQAELPIGPRRMRILQALDDALDVLDLQDITGTAGAARSKLAGVLADRASASEHCLAAMGHAHIDSAWLWPVRETIRKVARTASSMVSLLEESPDFIFGMSSAQQYAWIKEHRPEVYAKVRQAVAEGRFLPIGAMWVESDVVMPTGESLVRQFSYGQAFFQREFGVRCSGLWLPDTFGYSPALPQLMRRSGLKWFFTQKISWNQVNKFPHHTFLWEGIDGSQILTHFPPMDGYNSQLSGAEVARAARQFRESRVATQSIAAVGWGDGGGGTTREMLGRAARRADLEGSPKVSWVHPDDFFDHARAELTDPAVWVGELYLELHRATLTTQHQTKQGNRRCEQLLIEAEAWSAAASVETGAQYPHDEIEALWKDVLLYQFHDILPGTSIAWVHREAVELYERIGAAAEDLIARALQVLVGEGERTISVNGAVFARDGVPALGAVVAQASDAQPVGLTTDGDDFVLTNAKVCIRVSGQGLLTSAVDLASGHDVVAPGRVANLFQLHQDFPNMWDAWDVDSYYRNTVTDLRDVDSVEAGIDEAGRAVLTVTRSFGSSRIVQRIVLAPESATVLFETDFDWHETEKFLKVAFPFDIRADHTLAETQFGYQRRVTHTNTSWDAQRFETSMHRYLLVAEDSGPGAALINDSIYGHDITRDVADSRVVTTARLSLLRAPKFPDPRTDQGRQQIVYGLVVGADVAAATREGVLLNSAARSLRGDHGITPLVEVGGTGVVLSSVKLADDRSGDLVVRVYEALGRRTAASVAVRGGYSGVAEVNLLEEAVEAPAEMTVALTEAEGGAEATSMSFALLPFEVRTLRLQPAKS